MIREVIPCATLVRQSTDALPGLAVGAIIEGKYEAGSNPFIPHLSASVPEAQLRILHPPKEGDVTTDTLATHASHRQSSSESYSPSAKALSRSSGPFCGFAARSHRACPRLGHPPTISAAVVRRFPHAGLDSAAANSELRASENT